MEQENLTFKYKLFLILERVKSFKRVHLSKSQKKKVNRNFFSETIIFIQLFFAFRMQQNV